MCSCTEQLSHKKIDTLFTNNHNIVMWQCTSQIRVIICYLCIPQNQMYQYYKIATHSYQQSVNTCRYEIIILKFDRGWVGATENNCMKVVCCRLCKSLLFEFIYIQFKFVLITMRKSVILSCFMMSLGQYHHHWWLKVLLIVG